MTTVLAALDDSAAARPVLATALALAPYWHAEVVALHVDDDGGRNAQGAADFADTALQRASGDTVTQLLDRVRDEHVVALVVGARGSPGGRRPVGHVAQDVLRRCEKPVVVVPPDAPHPEVFRTMLVALEGDTACSQMLAPLFSWARANGLKIIAVHVDDERDVPRFSDQVQHEAPAFVSEFLARNAPDADDTQLELRIGVPAEQVLSVGEDLHADLVAVAWSRHLEPGRARFVRYVLEHSRVPVLLLPICDG